jgi:hypothetical protein
MKKSTLLAALVILLGAAWVGTRLLKGPLSDAPPEASSSGAARRQIVEQIPVGSNAGAESDANGPAPKWVVKEPIHDFGTMDAYTEGQHDFVVRNEGDAPLSLENHSTTCKCTLARTLARIDTPLIPPGGEGRVRLEWRTVGKQQYYGHGATLLTNDPKRKHLQLQIKGIVRSFVAAEPESLTFASVSPGETVTGETVVFSQSWNAFTVGELQSSIAGLTWELEPADAAVLKAFEATAAYLLRVTVPPDLPSGSFSGSLDFQVTPSGDAAAHAYKIPIQGKVLRRLSLYGPEIDENGVIDLGVVRQGTPLKKRLMMKIRDPDFSMDVRRIEVAPSFLKVDVTPYRGGAASKTGAAASSSAELGMYYLNLEVPADAPACGFTSVAPGKLRLEIEHPRIDELELQIKLTVVP